MPNFTRALATDQVAIVRAGLYARSHSARRVQVRGAETGLSDPIQKRLCVCKKRAWIKTGDDLFWPTLNQG